MKNKKGISIKAVFLGALIAIIVSVFIGLASFLVSYLTQAPGDHVSTAVGPIHRTVGDIANLGAMLLGAYVAGRIAQRAEIVHGVLAIMTIRVLLLTSLLALGIGKFQLLPIVGEVSAAVVGGWLASRVN